MLAYSLGCVFLITGFWSFLNHIHWDSYITAGWLIHYAEGFERRALVGSMIMLLNDFVALPLNIYAFIASCFFSGAFLYCLYQLVAPKRYHFLFYFVLFSPLGLSFIVNDSDAAGRTDNVLLAYVAFYALLLRRKSASPSIIMFSIALYGLVILTHEVALFFAPLLAIWSYVHFSKHHHYAAYAVPLGFLCTGGATALCLLFLTKETNEICNHLLVYGAPEAFCSGILRFSNNALYNLFFTLSEVYERLPYYLTYIISLPLCALPLYVYVKYVSLNTSKSTLKILLGVSVFCVLPLCLLGIDWGRWFHLWYMCLVICFISLNVFEWEEGTRKTLPLLQKLERLCLHSPRIAHLLWVFYAIILYRVPITKPGIRPGGFIPDTLYRAIMSFS